MTSPTPRIAVLMTCHNRRALTLRCLSSLAGQPLFEERNLFLVDDGCSDGTGRAVRDMMPAANVLPGDGSLFWNGGMRLAWDHATRAGGDFDFYLWLNDDVVLMPDALRAMVADADATTPRGGAIVVSAATCEPGEPDRITYGAHRRPDRSRPLRLQLMRPTGCPVPADTISGNIVLVSAAAQAMQGNLSDAFTHIYGDLDYGLRARAAGIPVVLASATGGSCAANPVSGTSHDATLSRLDRVRRRWREDGKLHARDWRRFVALHDHRPLSLLRNRLGPYMRILVGRPNRYGSQTEEGERGH